jgi:hypothetical protein
MKIQPPSADEIKSRKYGRLKPICEESGFRPSWRCLCDCGKTCVVKRSSMLRGNVRSCGCLVADTNRKFKTTHGESAGAPSRLYTIWAMMKQRCLNPLAVGYERYGGKGVTVCERWKNSYENFREDVGEPTSTKHTLDRFPDKTGNYEPGNVRWATDKEQNRNSANNRMIDFQGETKCLSEWCENLGLNYNTVHYRLSKGWPADRALK